ncbi:MAG: hypothetical protein HC912_09045 [Saprospiraceae bacterium]|nr:hypothetical protein [Saprospiraceae bacterium]
MVARQQDKVQLWLEELARKDRKAVGFIEETQRYYLALPHKAVPEEWVNQLQYAFFQDIEAHCKYFGWKYLMDWKVLASKAARESFWGASYLSNRTLNYFGIRHANKPWACQVFGFCDGFVKNDPEPASFVVFPDFKSSIWMFIHTMYSPHYLKRLPDEGARVAQAIAFEQYYGLHYWQKNELGYYFTTQLNNEIYTSEEIIYTWSEHPINNLCVNCNRATDSVWVEK